MKRSRLSVFKLLTIPSAILVLAIFTLLLFVIVAKALPAIERFGFSMFISSEWIAAEQPEKEHYGLLPAVWGSVYTAFVAALISLVLSVSYAIFVVDYAPKRVKEIMIILSDIMAGIPTIIYGIWGALVLVPFLRDHVMMPIYEKISFVPVFDYPPIGGYSYFAASVLLAIMITPFSSAVIREAYSIIPFSYREAVFSLGLTKYESIKILLGYIKPAIVSGTILSFGRAVGETVAVSLVIGNTFTLTTRLFSPGCTISSLIANQFGNAFIYEYMTPALFAAGLVLFFIGLAVHILGSRVLRRWEENVKI